MNERTHFFIKICISHTLISMFLWCVRDEWRLWQTAILTQLLLLTIATFLLHLGRGSLRATALSLQAGPLSLSLAVLSPTHSTAAGTCLYSFITPTCFRFFRLFPQVHLLIDGSVKGQYTTVSEFDLLSRYYVHFQTNTLGKGMNFLLFSSTIGWIVSLLFFSKDSCGIKKSKERGVFNCDNVSYPGWIFMVAFMV